MIILEIQSILSKLVVYITVEKKDSGDLIVYHLGKILHETVFSMIMHFGKGLCVNNITIYRTSLLKKLAFP